MGFDVCDITLAHLLTKWCKRLEKYCHQGAALYMYGGYGTPLNRAFYRFIIQLEHNTNWRLACPITWCKTKGRGIKANYLSTRIEIAYCVLGDIRNPRVFNIPRTNEINQYTGKPKRRTMIWNDVSEIMQGKTNECEKPPGLANIIIDTSSNPNDWILDAWAGSRNVAIQAEKQNRNVISIEK